VARQQSLHEQRRNAPPITILLQLPQIRKMQLPSLSVMVEQDDQLARKMYLLLVLPISERLI
jgi:hypothetical protein